VHYIYIPIIHKYNVEKILKKWLRNLVWRLLIRLDMYLPETSQEQGERGKEYSWSIGKLRVNYNSAVSCTSLLASALKTHVTKKVSTTAIHVYFSPFTLLLIMKIWVQKNKTTCFLQFVLHWKTWPWAAYTFPVNASCAF